MKKYKLDQAVILCYLQGIVEECPNAPETAI